MPQEKAARLPAYHAMRDALDDLGARALCSTVSSRDNGATVCDLWDVNGRVVILQTTWTPGALEMTGVDLFVPVTDSNRIDDTIAALRKWTLPKPAPVDLIQEAASEKLP